MTKETSSTQYTTEQAAMLRSLRRQVAALKRDKAAEKRAAQREIARARASEALMSQDFPGHYVEGYQIGVTIAKATGGAA